MHEHALTDLIRLSEQREAPKGWTSVELNADGRAVRRGSLASLAAAVLPIGRRHFYHLCTDVPVDLLDAEKVLSTFLTRETTRVRFRVSVVARQRNLEKIAESLHHPVLSPAEILLSTIQSALKALVDRSVREGPESVASRIVQHREEWQGRIEQTVEDKLGLEATVIFEGGHFRVAQEIALLDYPVRPKDAPHLSIGLSVYVTLEPTGDRARDALPAAGVDRERLLRGIVEDVVRGGVTLHDVWYEPGKVVDLLRDRIDRVCRTYAYRAADVTLKPLEGTPRQEEQIAAAIRWTGYRDRVVTFHVDAVMRLRPDGAGLYDALGRPDRRAWLAAEGEKALKAAMHGRDFFDLSLSEQRQVEERVRAILRDESARIGHGIDPLVAEVRLPENRWLSRQTITLDRERFKTRNEAAEAEFGIVLDLRFTTIRPLVAHLDQQPESRADAGGRNGETVDALIEQAIRGLVRRTVSVVMRQVEAGEYFAEWERWERPFEEDDGIVPRQADYVRNRVIREIRRELTQRFQPDLCRVTLHRIDGAVAELHRDMMALGVLRVEGLVDPRGNDRESEMVPFALVAHPSSLVPDRTAEALQRGPGRLVRERILDSLRGSAREFLHERSLDELRALDVGARDRLGERPIKAAMEEWLNRHMAEHYGFHIRLETVTTAPSLGDVVVRRGLSLPDHERLAAVDALLGRLRTEATVRGGLDEFTVAHLARLQESILANPRGTVEEQTRYRRELEQHEEALGAAARRRDEDRDALRRLAAGPVPSGPARPAPQGLADGRPAAAGDASGDPPGGGGEPPPRERAGEPAADVPPSPIDPAEDDITPPPRL